MSTDEVAITGLVSNIQRHSTEDGPGIRTTVFLMGCPMRCPWCQNPEAMSLKPQLVWHEAKCIGARDCITGCLRSALTLTPKGMIINRDLCDACGDCVDACPAAALEVMGEKMSAPDVAAKALRDKVFYTKSGGGGTLSGGEPAMQPEFARAIMESLRQEGIHVALDTCAGVSWEKLEPLVALADLVLLDLKIMDREKHKEHTGVPLELVLDNAVKINGMGKAIWVRPPIIPGFTDGEENIRNIARFIHDKLPMTERYDVLAFNNLCLSKYERLDRKYPLGDCELVRQENMESLKKVASEQGLIFVKWSGMTRRENK